MEVRAEVRLYRLHWGEPWEGVAPSTPLQLIALTEQRPPDLDELMSTRKSGDMRGFAGGLSRDNNLREVGHYAEPVSHAAKERQPGVAHPLVVHHHHRRVEERIDRSDQRGQIRP